MPEVIAWHHDALAADLARHLTKDGKNWVWLNATIGQWSGPRPDVMSFPRYRYDNPTIHAFEVKVSRADLLGDLNKEKWRKYLEHCQSVTFIMPSGLAKPDEIPAECGVMFRSARGWRTERRATYNGQACSIQAMAKLLTEHPWMRPREADRTVPEWRRDAWNRDLGDRFTRAAGRRLGMEVAKFARAAAEGRDLASLARQKADEQIERARALTEEFRSLLRPMLDELGLPHDADHFAIRQGVINRVAELQADKRVAAAEQALGFMRQSLARIHPLKDLIDGRLADPNTNKLFG
jgi:hypothetical protein